MVLEVTLIDFVSLYLASLKAFYFQCFYNDMIKDFFVLIDLFS